MKLERRAVWDIVLAVIIFIAGMTIGTRYIDLYQETAHGDFYQSEFGAAVLVACGHGFHAPAPRIPSLADFLNVKVDSFSCEQLPRDLATTDPSFMQGAHRYLMTAVGWTWRLSGKVSWKGLSPLFGFMFALTLCAAYALFRLACGPILSAVGVLPLAVSVHHLAYLPHLRDYSKAPFFLLLIFAVVQIAMPPFRARWSLWWAAAFGAILGISIGFRIDLIIVIPLFLCALAFFTPGRIQEHLRTKIASLALASLMFVLMGWPIFKIFGTESGTTHVSVLGLMTYFDAPLAVTRPVYSLGPLYLDGLADAVINAYGMTHGAPYAEPFSPGYENAGRGLLMGVVRHFPADIFIRGISSTLEVLDFPTTAGQMSLIRPYGITSKWALHLYDFQAQVLRDLAGIGPVAVVIVLLCVAAYDLRASIGVFLLLLYCCGYPATQFHIRHFFQLEFVVWLALFAVLARLGRLGMALFRRRWPQWSTPAARNVASMAVIIVVMVMLPAVSLRAYQQKHVAGLLDDYLRIPRAPLPYSTTTDGKRAHIDVRGLWEQPGHAPLRIDYVAAEFWASHCGAVDLPVRIRYAAAASDSDFSLTSRVPIDASASTVSLVPVFSTDYGHFTGFDLPAGYERCLKSVSRLTDLHNVPLMLYATLAPDWRATHLYQRLEKWESDSEPFGVRVRAVPDDLVLPADGAITTVAKPTADGIGEGIAVNSSAGTWFTPQPTRPQSSHQQWLNFPPETLDASAVLLVRGIVRKGGLRIGTTSSGRVIDSRAVLSPGPFTVMIGVPEAGAYGVRVTDESAPEWRREGNAWLRRLVWWTMPSVLADNFELQQVAWVHFPR